MGRFPETVDGDLDVAYWSTVMTPKLNKNKAHAQARTCVHAPKAVGGGVQEISSPAPMDGHDGRNGGTRPRGRRRNIL